MSGRIALAVLLALGASRAGAVDPEPPAPTEEPAAEAPDPMPVPPGSPADQALWKDTRDVTHEVVAARFRANGLHLAMRNADLVDRLDAAAQGDPSAAPRLYGLRRRLHDLRMENYEILTTRWPVDTTRVCQYPLVDLTSAMHGSDGPGGKAALAQARDGAKRCVELARTAVGRLQRSNAAFAAAIAEAERAVPPAGSPTPEKR